MKTLILNYLTLLRQDAEEELCRLYVHLKLSGDRFKTILITSSVPKEGKSFVAMNLWRLLSGSGARVVLIDADVGGTSLSKRYRFYTQSKEMLGLSHYLAGQAELEDVLYQTNFQNGCLVPTVRGDSVSAALMGSDSFFQLLEGLKKEFDYVLIDAPGLNTAHSLLMAGQCDGSILVVRSGATSRGLIAGSLKQLELAGCELIGVALNRVEPKRGKNG